MRATAELAGLAAVAAAGIGTIAWILWKSRKDPRELERRRRTRIAQHGRMGDGYINDVGENAVYYTYSVHGVEYAASQDITALRDILPEDLNSLIGPVTLKFLPANPCNSIVVGENWVGIRGRQPRRMLLKGA